MDAVAPALIGIGLYLAYVAWESHKNQTSPNPLTKIINAVQNPGSGASTGTTGTVANPNPQSTATVPGSVFLP